MSITTELSSGFILVCILIGASLALFLYFKEIRQRDKSESYWPVRILTVLRFLSVTLVCILLLNPLLKYLQRDIEKPVVILAIDNSESMIMGRDSLEFQTQFNETTKALREKLATKYELYSVLAGDGTRTSDEVDFKDQTSDLSDAFQESDLIYRGKNLVATILISDGIVNRGLNPLYVSSAITTPLYSVGTGDTNVHKDVRIYEAKANGITFLGNTFPVEVVINADKCAGNTLELSLYRDGVKEATTTLIVQGDRYSGKHTFLLKASEVGSRRYQVRVSSVNGEANFANNRKWVYTDVLDGRQKIALVAIAPHPDLAAIKSMIESNDQYEVSLFLGSLPSVKKGDFDLIITHQLPVSSFDFNWIQHIIETKIPTFFILGSQTQINLFNKINTGITITGNRSNYNQSLAIQKSTFSLFELSESFPSFLNNSPPLLTPFGGYSVTSPQGVLFNQRIGQVDTELPLMYFNDKNGYRMGVLCGEGIWRWKMFDFETHDHFDHVNELLSRTIQYLSIKGDKRKFRMYTSSRLFAENESVNFFADVYNDSYEFTPDADVRVKLVNEAGDEFAYALSPTNGMYRHKLGTLPEGRYTYHGTSRYNGKTDNVSGSFVVHKLELEATNLTADFGWMRKASLQSGGKFYLLDQTDVLANDLLAREDAEAISYSSYTMKDVIDQKWIFFVILLLLGSEWFMRRWLGGY
jgi:hypothetical protein